MTGSIQRVGREIGRGPWAAPVWVAALCLLAYRALWLTPHRYDVEGFLFRPGELPVLAVLALSAWLLWRRRNRLRAVKTGPAPILAFSLAALGSGLFAWALLTEKTDLLLPSLAANGLAFAAAIRGSAGCRSALFPALVLLLGVQLPKPLEDEIVWNLQVWTAQGAGWLLAAIGREFLQGGVILRNPAHTFHVIDSCSGLNGMVILTGVALVVRELFADAGWRSWLLVVLAPILSVPLNVLRVAYVAASPNPEALAGIEGDHTPQGLAVVMMGTAILYAVGWAMANRSTAHRPTAENATRFAGDASIAWWVTAAWITILALVSWILPPFSESGPSARLARIELPEQKSGWASEPAPHDPFFTGVFSSGLHRRYQFQRGPHQPAEALDLLIGYADPNGSSSSRLMSSKLLTPGPDWDLVGKRHEHLWSLDRGAELAIASRKPGGEHAVIYAWRPHDEGLWRESWRALLGLDASPFRRDGRRAVVRLIAYAPHGGQLALDRAKQRLDSFILALREELAGL